MKVTLQEITVGELVDGYNDDPKTGEVIGYGGKLDIRPKFQREFVYKDEQRDAVINTVQKDFPLNVMYWAVRDDGNFDVIDGQQRTISLCQYATNEFSIDGLAFHNLPKDKQEQIMNYSLQIYFCSGPESEKLEWFKTINTAGEKLTSQELRNAVYSGDWVSDAKRYFSKPGCVAYGIASNYVMGSAIRQDYLETVIDWISEDDKIEDYMSKHQHDKDAKNLWIYFQAVINWVETIFSTYRKEMKGVPFGVLYNEFKDKKFDAEKLEIKIAEFMADEEVTNKKGIYSFVLTKKEKYLNLRKFNDRQKREAYEKQKGICPICKEHFEIEKMDGDHMIPWYKGGKTISENCQMLCKKDNGYKSGT
jgi:hypothetical protein